MKTDPMTVEMISKIEGNIEKTGSKFWKRILKEINKKSQAKRIVNISHVNKQTKKGDSIIVPGKLLGDAELDKEITITYFNASASAEEKMKKAKVISLQELLKKNPEGKGVRILG